jgi:hypothetical protein
MKKTFGLSCSLIVINSAGGRVKDYWAPGVDQFASLARKVAGKCEDPAPIASIIPQPGPYGSLLSQQDVERIETFIKSFSSQNLIPFMERNIQAWHIEVKSKKKGYTGKLFNAGRSFFGGGSPTVVVPDTFVVGDDGNHVFVGTSHELLQRRLADYAFMIRDYRFAYSIYDGLRKDIQGNENALYYMAGCQEMLGICTMMVDSSGKGSVDAYVDAAIDGYRKVEDFVYETRACMLFYEVIKEKGFHKDAPFILNKMTGVLSVIYNEVQDSEFRSALFLEQSALCYLTSKPIAARKYGIFICSNVCIAFYLILAEKSYRMCDQTVSAIRCLESTIDIYMDRGWSLIEDDVYYNLAHHNLYMGNVGDGINFLAKLLRASRQAPEEQGKFLVDLYNVYKVSMKINLDLGVVDRWRCRLDLKTFANGFTSVCKV